jgi:hypothetical protein
LYATQVSRTAKKTLGLAVLCLSLFAGVWHPAIARAQSWTGEWREFPGGGHTSTALTEIAFHNRLYVFARGIDDEFDASRLNHDGVWVNVVSADPPSFMRTWSGWKRVLGGMTTDTALTAVVSRSQLFLFAKDIVSNQIHVNVTSDGTTWSGWGPVPGGFVTKTTPAASSTSVGVRLFAVGTDGKAYSNVAGLQPYSDGTPRCSPPTGPDCWSGWTLIPDGPPPGPSPSIHLKALSASSGASRDAYLIARAASDNRVLVNSSIDGKTWQGWGEVQPRAWSEGAAVIADGYPDNLFLLCTGVRDRSDILHPFGYTDWRIYINEFRQPPRDKVPAPGGGWEGWQEVPTGGPTGVPPVAGSITKSSVSALAYSTTSIHLLSRGPDDRIYENTLKRAH